MPARDGAGRGWWAEACPGTSRRRGEAAASPRLSGPNGLCPIVELNLAKDGSFESGKIHSCKQPGEGGPRIDPENEVLQEIISLNQTDLPESNLKIGADGSLGFL